MPNFTPNKQEYINGFFCISLDFEKYWGVHDVKSMADISHFKKSGEVVFKLLQLFDKYAIHTTWATVGLLQNPPTSKSIEVNNVDPIPYSNKNYSPFPFTVKKYGDFNPDLLDGKKEITAILRAPNQELASHTFSHFYCIESGINSSHFEKDCLVMTELAAELNTRFTSIVFPRNQIKDRFLEVCNAHFITAYRGNQENKYWRNSSFEKESIFKKVGRVADAYFKISKTKTYSIKSLQANNGVLNIPANRFFRPVTNKKWLEKRKIKRIKAEMKLAAIRGTVYHLWWHPHNFTLELEKSLAQLEELLAYQNVLSSQYNFQSLNMAEIVTHAKS